MELILFIYVLVAIVVTGYILLTREQDVATTATATATTATAITATATTRLVEWAEDGHMPAAVPVPVYADDAAAVLLPGEEEDKWEDLAEDWEFPEIGKNDHNRALRRCGRHGKGKQKGGKHIDKKRLRRADTRAHLSILELI